MQIIVVHFDRIHLHALGAESPAVIKIGSTARTHDRLQFPLRDRRLPKVEADVLLFENILCPTAQVTAVLESEK